MIKRKRPTKPNKIAQMRATATFVATMSFVAPVQGAELSEADKTKSTNTLTYVAEPLQELPTVLRANGGLGEMAEPQHYKISSQDGEDKGGVHTGTYDFLTTPSQPSMLYETAPVGEVAQSAEGEFLIQNHPTGISKLTGSLRNSVLPVKGGVQASVLSVNGGIITGGAASYDSSYGYLSYYTDISPDEAYSDSTVMENNIITYYIGSFSYKENGQTKYVNYRYEMPSDYYNDDSDTGPIRKITTPLTESLSGAIYGYGGSGSYFLYDSDIDSSAAPISLYIDMISQSSFTVDNYSDNQIIDYVDGNYVYSGLRLNNTGVSYINGQFVKSHLDIYGGSNDTDLSISDSAKFSGYSGAALYLSSVNSDNNYSVSVGSDFIGNDTGLSVSGSYVNDISGDFIGNSYGLNVSSDSTIRDISGNEFNSNNYGISNNGYIDYINADFRHNEYGIYNSGWNSAVIQAINSTFEHNDTAVFNDSASQIQNLSGTFSYNNTAINNCGDLYIVAGSGSNVLFEDNNTDIYNNRVVCHEPRI